MAVAHVEVATEEEQAVSGGSGEWSTAPVVPTRVGVVERAIAEKAEAGGRKEERSAGGFVGETIAINAIYVSPYPCYIRRIC